MALDFNTEPYYDDYSAEKDFYRILFRPSYAVQARELTQIQTILQNQVTRFGDHVFKNGSQVIPGSVNIDNKVHFVKLEQFTGTIDVTTYIETLKNKIVTGETSGVKMRVVDTSGGGFIVDNLDIPTLYCKVEGTASDNVTNRLVPGENLIAYAEDNQISTNFRLTEDQLSDITCVVKLTGNLGETATTYANNPSSDVLGYAYSVEVQQGIYYVDGIFVRNDNLKLYVGRFTNTPSYRVGFKVTEEYITPEDDESIQDNATGSPNFAAPGAHRYKISLSLVKLDLVATDNIRFVELVRVVEGRIQYKIDRASYSELEKTFARRTYDESGNYEVNKFKLSVREHLDTGTNLGVYPELDGAPVSGVTYGNSDKFVMVVDPGKAYIQGYEVESTASQFIDFNKAREIGGQENNHVQRIALQTIGLNVGNYAKVQNLYKYPSINTFEKVYLVNTLTSRVATLRAIISGGNVTSIVVDDGGEGYTGTPTINIVSTSSVGSGATATATVANGKITAVTVNNQGTSYNSVPEVRTVNNISLGAAPTASNIVGTARVKSIQLNSGVYSNYTSTEYKLGLFDVNMFKGYSFERDVKSITGQNGAANFTCNISPTYMQLIGSATATNGSATVTGVGTNFTDVLKAGDVLYINDIKVGVVASTPTNNLSVTLTTNYTGTTITGGRVSIFTASLFESAYETLLFPVGQRVVKTLRGVDNSGNDTAKRSAIIVRRLFNIVNTQTNKASFEVTDTNETFLSDAELSNYLLINADTNLPANITETSITFDSEVTRKVVNFNNVPNGNYYLIASVQQEEAAAQEKTKVINRNQTQTITGKKILSDSSVEIQHADILRLISVEMTPGDYDAFDPDNAIDITNRYTLDNGQRSTYYTNGKLLLKAGYQVPSGAIKVTYDYFSVGVAQGNYFSVDSYLTASGVTYEEIPSYYVTDAATGKKVEVSLTDVVDFRPILTNTNYFYPQIPKIGSDMVAPTANYLGRVDKLVLDSVGKFNVISGVPEFDPKEPEDPKEGLILATVSIPPYTKKISDVIIKQRDNRRYTMRDIGKLERRISNLEYYVSLSLLEKDTATLQVRDETTGLDRFKNGFIVDQFTGHGVGDVKNDDYRVSVDTQNRILRPMHDSHALELVEDLASGTDRAYKPYKKTGDVITLPYNENAYIFNNHATRAMDIHAISMGAFKGQINLFPEGDNWKSTERRPDLVAVDDNNYDAIKFLAEELGVTGTKWNEWQTNWTSIVSRPPVASETRQWTGSNILVTGYETTFTDYVGYNWRDGINTSLTSSVNAQDYGDRVVDMSYIPFMRARPVSFIAQNLKGTTQFWPFFDGTAIDAYVKPADKFVVTRVGQSIMSFDQNDLNANVLADTPRRAHNSRIEPAFSVGDALTNTTHTATSINSIVNLTSEAASFSLVVADSSNIRPGHHVVLYNLNYHNAYNEQNLSDLLENQIIPASAGINDTANMSKELNLRKFKVTAVSGQSITLANIDGSMIQPFSAYTTDSYVDNNKGKLLRLKASGVVLFGGPIITSDAIGPIQQEINLVNIKNGFAVGETLTGTVTIGTSSSFNGVTVTSINGSSTATSAPPVMSNGDNIITDINGTAVGVFYIPETAELSFRTGERTFKLTDNQSNSNASFDSIGSAVYYSQGISLSKERTIVSTRTAQFVQASTYEDTQSLPPVRRTTTSSRQLYQYAYDPLAQTFTISSPGGCFVTSLDLYFSAKGTRPVTVEIRNTDNGVPSSKVVPFSQVTKTASELNVSETSINKTTFKFKSPIYLQDTETYAFVVMTDEPGTQLYVSEMGGTDIVTGNTIAGQPLTGSLYASQNAKEWEIHPLLDMKFVLNKATFDIGTSAEVMFRANPPEVMSLAVNPFEITPNTNKIRVYAKNHGLNADEIVTISGVAEGYYGANSSTVGIPHTLLNTKHTVSAVGLEKDSFVIDLVTVDAQSNSLLSGTNSDFIKGEYGGNGIKCSRGIQMDMMFFKTSDLNFQETKIEYYASAQEPSGNYTNFLPFVANSNYSFPTRMHIRSYENQYADLSGKKSSLQVKAVLTSTNENVSPAIDLQQISAFAISNLIDDHSSTDINVPEIDSREILGAGDLIAADISSSGAGVITCTTGSATVTGVNTLFTTQAVAGNVLKNSAGTTIGTIQSIASNTSLTLTGNAAVAVTSGTYYIYSTPSLVFENVGGVGVIRTNIDTADNLLASAGIGKTIVVSGADSNTNGTYVVRDILVVEDKTTYAGNAELDTTKIVLDRPFGGTLTLDMITDPDFSIVVYDKFVDDTAPYGSHNSSNYITRTLSLSQAADTLKVIFDANIVNNTEIKVYYRTWTGNVDLRKIPYKDTGFVSTNLDPEGRFVERTIDVIGIESFNNVSIKIVLKSNDPVFVPKIKNLRLLALS